MMTVSPAGIAGGFGKEQDIYSLRGRGAYMDVLNFILMAHGHKVGERSSRTSKIEEKHIRHLNPSSNTTFLPRAITNPTYPGSGMREGTHATRIRDCVSALPLLLLLLALPTITGWDMGRILLTHSGKTLVSPPPCVHLQFLHLGPKIVKALTFWIPPIPSFPYPRVLLVPPEIRLITILGL